MATDAAIGASRPWPAAAGPTPPWAVSDSLWQLVEPLLPKVQRRTGRPRLPDRSALEGILFVLHSGIAWQQLPTEIGLGSGFTCWRRLVEWQELDAWDGIQALLVARLPAADQVEWSRASLPSDRPNVKRRSRARARAGADPGR